MANKLRILFVCSEVTPLAKTGGLADVCGALPTYLAGMGHQVDVALPWYKSIDLTDAKQSVLLENLAIKHGDATVSGKVVAADVGKPWRALLVDQPDYFHRDGLYTDPLSGKDYPDNAERFSFFAKAVVATIREAKLKYDIVHAHDWQTALVISYLRKQAGDDPLLGKPATLFTIHNLGYQGLFPAEAGKWFDLPDAFNIHELEFYGQWSLLKGALKHADFISTVSVRYAKEIQTTELGFGLDDVLVARADRLLGITHGVDGGEWNPATDKHLAANYSADKPKGKAACKADLLKRFNLPAHWEKRPLLGFVGRLIEQKGLDLIMAVADDLVAHGFTLAFLGAGEKKYEGALRDLAARFPEQVGARIGFDEVLAHKITAGADLLLLPSIYEPCGLSQMYAHKYGTIPVVRATGGLDDTVSGWAKGKRNADGFKFTDPNPEALLKVLADAADLFEDAKRWKKLVANAFAMDHSWEAAAGKYDRLYRKIIRLKKEAAQ